MGGFIPGTLMGLGLDCVRRVVFSNRQGYAASEKLSRPRLSPGVSSHSLGGLADAGDHPRVDLLQATSPSREAAAIAVDYTLLLAWLVYRSLDFKRFYELVVGRKGRPRP